MEDTFIKKLLCGELTEEEYVQFLEENINKELDQLTLLENEDLSKFYEDVSNTIIDKTKKAD